MDRRGRLLRALHATLLASSRRAGGAAAHQATTTTTAAAATRLASSSTSSASASASPSEKQQRPARKSTTPTTKRSASQRLFSALAEPAPRQAPLSRARLAGQPTPHTHPELLRPGELLPGVRADELARRRAALAALLPPDSVAVVPAQAISFVTGVIPHPYRQDADFAYLTGVQQQAVAVIATGPAAPAQTQTPPPPPPRIAGAAAINPPPPPSTPPPPPSFTYSLFVPQPDRDRETWDGAWLGREAAREVFGASPGEAHHAHELKERLVPLLAGARAVFFDLDRPGGYMYAHVRGALEEVARRASHQQQQQQRASSSSSSSSPSSPSSSFASSPPRVHALRPLMHRLRWVKSPSEVALMAASASAAADSVAACMAATSPGAREAALAALFEYRCRLRGASRCAYPSVVASGSDACTIHYSRNDKVCRSGDLLLMDAGCELHGYASDVTRTWPVGGKFSGPQRQLYGAVLLAREKVLAAAVEGASLARLHALCVSLLSQALIDLGLVRGMSLDAVMAGPYKLSWCFFWVLMRAGGGGKARGASFLFVSSLLSSS